MGARSTAVKKVCTYELVHANGSRTRIRDIHFVDPSKEETLVIHREISVQPALDLIEINFTL